MTDPVGHLARDPARPERWTLFHSDGRVSNRFGRDTDRAEIAAVLADAGMVLRDDDTVVLVALPHE
jgi:hypothetical protein